MEFERRLQRWGLKSAVIVIPPDVLKFLEIEPEDILTLKVEEKSKGKFVSFWKKVDKNE